jgi:hypothetical protein
LPARAGKDVDGSALRANGSALARLTGRRGKARTGREGQLLDNQPVPIRTCTLCLPPQRLPVGLYTIT